MAKKVQLQSNPKKWEVVDGVEVLVDQEIHDLDPMTDSSCVKIEGHRTLEETLSQDNMFTPEITETKVMTEVGGVYHDNVVDGAYEQAILYGNTQVNLSEAATEGSKYIPLPFTSFQGNEKKVDTQKSNYTCQVAPLIKGVTMVNLAQETSSSVPSGSGVWVNNVKPSTKYTLILTYTIQNSQKGLIIQSYNDTTYLENSKQITSLETNVQLTFTTHENANTIRICNAEGYGGETIQLDDIMVLEGDMIDLDIPFFKGMRSVELVRPLTNLFTDDLVPETMGATVTNSGGTVTVTSTTVTQWASARYYLDLKPNTKYVIMWDSLTFTQTAGGIDYIISVCENDTIFSHMGNKFTTLRSIIFNTGNKSAISIRIHATTSNSETGTTTVKGLRVFEWDDSLRTLDLQTIGYFSGTKNVCQHVFKTESKNLYPYGDVKFTATSAEMWCDAKGTQYMYTDVAKKSKARFLLKKGTYCMTRGITSNCEAIAITDDKNSQMVYGGNFTVDQDTYFTLVLKTLEANVETTVTNIQIERGETATTYSTYHGRAFIANGNDEIVLRSLPNGVCDTYNLQTGELVQNIGEVVLDGDENIKIVSSVSNDTHTYFDFDTVFTGALNNGDLICDSFAHINGLYGSAQTVEGINIGSLYWGSIRILNSRLSSIDVNGFKTWLQENPVTVQYELETPIIKTITTYDRTYVPYSTTKVSIGNNLGAFAYDTKDHMMIVGNLSPVPPIVESITELPYKMRLKPNTTYTVKCVRGNSQTMSFDLGGTVYNDTTPIINNGGLPYEALIKTPVSQLSHDYLKISGTGFAQKIVVVEGDIRGTELPYFKGMCNAKMPIVKNVGKNLFDGELYINIGINNAGTTVDGYPTGMHPSEDWVTTKNLIPVKIGEKISITIDADDSDITQNRRYVYVYKYDQNKNFKTNDRYDLGVNTKTFTMTHDGYIRCTIKTHNVNNITITKTDTPQSYTNYKENQICITQGELPFGAEFMEQGGFSMAGSGDGSYEKSKYDGNNTIRLRSKDLISVKPNTTYGILNTLSTLCYNVYQWDGNRRFLDGLSKYFQPGSLEVFTTSPNTHYIHFLMSKPNANNTISLSEYDWSQFHIYELDSTINLRSLPNGVKDELNLLTGEYIQRVGEIVLDENESWSQDITASESTSNTNIFYTAKHQDFKPLATAQRESGLLCDKMKVIASLFSLDIVGVMTNLDPRAYIRLPKNVAYDVPSLKTYLQSNPVTIQYELAEPIISHVRIVSSNAEREVGVKLPYGVSNTYNPSTGITTVRVGKVVLDGSEEYLLHKKGDRTTVWYTLNSLPNVMNFSENTSVVAEGINAPYPPKQLENQTQEVCYISNTGKFNFTLLNTKASTVDELKTYLASNPITVWYELKYPQIEPDIVLPNGVHDEYNPETGVYTKRIGFIEFDGSADENWGVSSLNGTITSGNYCYYYNKYSNAIPESQLPKIGIMPLCDKLQGTLDSIVADNPMSISIGRAEQEFRISIPSGESSATACKQWLAANPIKVWYELQTPITYQLTPYSALPTPYAYEDGYIIMESVYPETTLPPEFNYKLLANRTGQVMQNNRKLQEHTTRLSNLEAIIIEATIESLFNREMQSFELELMNVQLVSLD